MKINLKNIKIYFLTFNNKLRKNNILENFKERNLIEVNPRKESSKMKSGATGFSRVLDLAIQNQNRDEKFQPFMILEDDVTKYRDFPDELEVPNDSDVLYIGLSNYGVNSKGIALKNFYYKNINEDLIKIYNMLSFHGSIITSFNGVLKIQKCLLEGYFKNSMWDIFIAQVQPYYNAYALKIPLVYQDKKVGGQEEDTKISLNVNTDNIIPREFINVTNISNLLEFK